jgi:S-formylglutathione hydrolase
MWDYVAEDLPALLTASPRRERQAITGHSMGGHGALTIAMGLPGRFRGVGLRADLPPHRQRLGAQAARAYLGETMPAGPEHDATLLMRDRGFDGPMLIDTGHATSSSTC